MILRELLQEMVDIANLRGDDLEIKLDVRGEVGRLRGVDWEVSRNETWIQNNDYGKGGNVERKDRRERP